MKALINVTYYDFLNYQEASYIVFDEEIKDVGKMSEYVNLGYDEIDVSGKLVMPSLVNGHSHIYSTFARGLNVPFNPTDFKELLEQLWWKLDRNLDNEMNYYSSLVSGIEYIKNGVTTIIDHHASGEIIDSLSHIKKGLDEVGLRGIYCFETSDRFNIEECIKENTRFITSNVSNKARGLFGMHAAFTLSDDTLKKIGEVNKSPIHIHVAESKMDQDLSLSQHDMRVVNRLDKFNLISRNSILTHCLYLEDEELDIIKEKEAVIALNVTSNMNNGVGLPDYPLMKKKGIKVIVGNDGIRQSMASEYQMLYYAMHYKTKSPMEFGFNDVIKVINDTYQYASEILHCKLGKISKGFMADMLVLPYNPYTELDETNIFGHLFFGLFNDFKPETVFVGGNKILSNFEVDNELKKKYSQAKHVSKRLFEKIEMGE